MPRHKSGETPAEEWSQLAERTNKYIDFKKVNSEEDYHDALERVFTQVSRPDGKKPTWFPKSNFEDIAENNRELKNRLKEAQQERVDALKKAQNFHRRRRKHARTVDERKTHRRTSRATRGAVSRWKKNPARSDIRGVDTRLASKLSRRNQINSRDLSLKNYIVTLDTRGVKRYRGLDGRYVRNPFLKSRK
jgi:hypothetical protein